MTRAGGDEWPLDYVSYDGRRVSVKVTTSASEPSPDGHFLVRDLFRPHGGRLIQKVVPRGSDEAAAAALDRAIRAGMRLQHCFDGRGGPGYPAELEKLVGYDVDVAEPFVLLETPDPQRAAELPVAEKFGQLPDESAGFWESLLGALRCLEAAGLVHRALDGHTVRWTGQGVRIVDFSSALVLGDQGTSQLGPGDDVHAALILYYQVMQGRAPRRGPEPTAEEIKAAGLWRLSPLFAQRKPPSEVYPLLGLPDPLSGPAGGGPVASGPVDPSLEVGRAEFTRVLESKNRNKPGNGADGGDGGGDAALARRKWWRR
jgi:hypothetical protein